MWVYLTQLVDMKVEEIRNKKNLVAIYVNKLQTNLMKKTS